MRGGYSKHDLAADGGSPHEADRIVRNLARYNFRREEFPVIFEGFHPVTGAVVWREVIRAPDGLAVLAIPPLALICGHLVGIRIITADGEIHEQRPPQGSERIQ